MSRAMIDIKRISETVSILFSAPFIASYILARLFIDRLISIQDLMYGLLCLTILPVIIPLYYSWKKGIEWDYPEREHRITPFSIIVLIYLLLLVYSYIVSDKLLLLISGSYFVNGLISLIITFRYKISIHMVGIYGPATLMYLLEYFIDAVVLALVGVLTGFSRYILNRHSLVQIVFGALVSIFATLIVYIVVYTH